VKSSGISGIKSGNIKNTKLRGERENYVYVAISLPECREES
jgi:hypothetical protein